MHHFAFLASCLSVATLWTTAGAQDVGAYLAKEKPIAKAGIFANIGGSGDGIGTKVPGAKPGLAIASPQKENPNYFYFWLRDGSLAFKYIIDEVVSGQDTNPSHIKLIEQFISAMSELQDVENLSGPVASGENLNEAKFMVDGTAFTELWPRPQRDGPALRITALTTYAKYLISQSNSSYVSTTIWPIIKRDAEYIVKSWNKEGWDLWEEFYSQSFFTTAVQHRGLREAIALAGALGQDSSVSNWSLAAQETLCLLQSYWSDPSGYMFANTGSARTGLDANTVLASIHTYDSEAGCDAVTFQPCSDKALVNLVRFVDTWRNGAYGINAPFENNRSTGIAVGRYREDIYQMRNPWFLTTFAVPEQLHLALSTWSKLGAIEVTATSLPFFQLFIPSITPSVHASNSSTYSTLISAISEYADSFIAIAANYTPTSGALSEQYNRVNGVPISAADFTWSYASLLTLADARDGTASKDSRKFGNMWGAKGLKLSDTCAYRNGGVSVTFYVNATTKPDELVWITGNVAALSYWHPPASVAMSTTQDTYPIWKLTVNGLAAGSRVEYKYRKGTADVWAWAGGNRGENYTIDTGNAKTKEVRDIWRD